MKQHIPLTLAVIILTVTVFLAVRFTSTTRQVIAIQADLSIQLPVAPRESAVAPSEQITVRIAPGGTVHHRETALTDSTLTQLLAENTSKQIKVESHTGAKYHDLKAFLTKLQSHGVTNVVLTIASY
jgi:biopolymer transport protein ExbD